MARMPTIDVVDGMRCMTLVVTVRRTRELKLRLRVAMWLLRLAARIANMNIEIED